MEENSRQASRRATPLPVRRALRETGDHVAVWRKLRGLTQAQLADRANVTRQTVARLEGGDGAVSLEVLLKILRALGVMDSATRALDPYESDIGRLRSEQQLPQRVRPRNLGSSRDA